MDPSLIWPELAKMGIVALLMGVAIWWLAGRLKASEEEVRKSQEFRLSELKETNALYNKYSVQMDTVIKIVETVPSVIATNHEKIVDAFEDFKRELKK